MPSIPVPTENFDPRYAVPVNTTCIFHQKCLQYLISLKIDTRYLDIWNSRCFCSNCFPQIEAISFAGNPSKKFELPRGWVKIPLFVDGRLHETVWNDYQIAYQGVPMNVAGSIIESSQLLLSDETTCFGVEVSSKLDLRYKI